jgi:ABC-2 type transport system ATP-binding protein
MHKLGKRQLTLELHEPIREVPARLADLALELQGDGKALVYTYDSRREETGISDLLRRLDAEGLALRDVQSRQSSLEEIFVSLVRGQR